MMTKEEVAGIVAYCTENNISQKQRRAELGISEWQFYSSKRKYAHPMISLTFPASLTSLILYLWVIMLLSLSQFGQ